MQDTSKKTVIFQYAGSLFGILLFTGSLNLLISPLKLYSGNLTGVAQIINTTIHEIFHPNIPKYFDLLGIIVFAFNVPLFILAYKKLSKRFFFRTIVCVTFESFAFSMIPVLKTPVLKDPLTACIIGGIITGYGVGITLKYGGSGGGTDILGMYCAQKYPNFSVGKISMLLSSMVFLYCALRYNLENVVYSAIFISISAITTDCVHDQNIKISAMIITKVEAIEDCIIKELYRGATRWIGEGSYTHEKTYVFMTVISKYEADRLKNLIHEKDPDAFIILNNKPNVFGNFIKRL